MAKTKSFFVCEQCQAQFPTWAGRCLSCGAWNSLIEKAEGDQDIQSLAGTNPATLYNLKDISLNREKKITTGFIDFDRVLNNEEPGIVEGSVILIAGSPGVGKSTLLLQICSKIKRVIYFSAEESLEQLKIRAGRLGVANNDLKISAERKLGSILSSIERHNPALVVIDSVQTIYDEQSVGTPGSINQVREACWKIMRFAKQKGISFLLVGHITKEGVIAGPKVLEHLVDAVLYLEGDKRTGLRLLRSEKNRFGSTEEVGIYQLTGKGFQSIEDAGKLFLELIDKDAPGRALTLAMEGSRPLLMEVQALAVKTAFGIPKRSVQGFDLGRLNLILAVLENKLNLPIGQYDVFLNIAGGFYLKDTAADLSVAGAILSSLKNKTFPEDLVLIGEIGLLGEIRPVTQRALRAKEANRLKLRLSSNIGSVAKLPTLFLIDRQNN